MKLQVHLLDPASHNEKIQSEVSGARSRGGEGGEGFSNILGVAEKFLTTLGYGYKSL